MRRRYKTYQPGDTSHLLDRLGIEYTVRGRELLTDCIFGSCDEDSRQNEHHLSLNDNTGQYQCFKCGAKGNYITLIKYLKENNYEL